jgi:hypothetical protein
MGLINIIIKLFLSEIPSLRDSGNGFSYSLDNRILPICRRFRVKPGMKRKGLDHLD